MISRQLHTLVLGAALAALLGGLPAHADDLPADLVAAAKQEGTISFYTSSRRETLDALAAKFKELYGITVEVTRKDAGAIVQQVETERRINRPGADVVQVGNEGVMLNWLRDGYLAKYRPTAASVIPEGFQLAGGDLIGPYVNLQAPCYNTKLLDAAHVPTSYEDFLDPSLKGKIVIVDPHTAGPGPAIVRLLSKDGWDFVEKLAAQKPLVVEGVTTQTSMVGNGEAVLGLQCNTSQVTQLKAKGTPIDTAWLAKGVPTVFSAAGIAATAPHPNAARLFVEFLLAPDSEKIHAEGGYKVVLPGVDDMVGEVKVPILVPDWDWLEVPENAQQQNDQYMRIMQGAN